MPAGIEWTYPVVVSELPEHGAEFTLVPDEAARASLAKLAGVIAMPQMTAEFQVTPAFDGGATLEGSLEATVTQECVVTLERFDNKVSERISLRFAPEGSAVAVAETDGDNLDSDPPDELTNGALDLAAVAAEFLVLGVDPYPRKPGAEFKAPEAGERPSAFAALEQLKLGKGEGKG